MSRDPCKTVSRARVLPLLRVLGALWVVAALAGCATTAKLNAFGELSKVGVAYADAADAVIAQAAGRQHCGGYGGAGRDAPRHPGRRPATHDADRSIERYERSSRSLAIFNAINRSSRITSWRWVRWRMPAIRIRRSATAAGDTITALGKLSSGFAGKTMAANPCRFCRPERSARGCRAPVSRPRARVEGQRGHHQSRARGSEQLMGFLADKIKSDDAAFEGPREAAAVFGPYTANAPLPADWPAQRSAFLRRSARSQCRRFRAGCRAQAPPRARCRC